MPRFGWLLFLILVLSAKPTLAADCAQESTLPIAAAPCAPVFVPQGPLVADYNRARPPALSLLTTAKRQVGYSPFGSDCPDRSPADLVTLPSLQTYPARGKICGDFSADLPQFSARMAFVAVAGLPISKLAGQFVSPRDRLLLICLLRC